MTLEEQLKKAGIEKILVVDDRQENISAAKEYFDEHFKKEVDYAHSESEALERIRKEYQDQKYDLVLSDMQMEKKDSGKTVIFEALKHKAYSLIITAKDAYSHGGISHDESTTIISPHIEYRVTTKKSDPRTWAAITEKFLEHIERDGKSIFGALKRQEKYVSAPSEYIAKLMMLSYSFEK